MNDRLDKILKLDPNEDYIVTFPGATEKELAEISSTFTKAFPNRKGRIAITSLSCNIERIGIGMDLLHYKELTCRTPLK